MLNSDVKICNCAECGKELTVCKLESQVAGRIKGRPYCSDCLEVLTPSSGTPSPMEDTGGYQDIAIRIMEDGTN